MTGKISAPRIDNIPDNNMYVHEIETGQLYFNKNKHLLYIYFNFLLHTYNGCDAFWQCHFFSAKRNITHV